MGGVSSKAARKLPKHVEKPSWAGARTPTSRDPNWRPTRPPASEAKEEAFEQDSRDPHLLSNLSRLGAVRVDHHMQTIRPGEGRANRMYQSRMQSEAEATPSNTTRNRLLASSLSELLDERKAVESTKDLQALANKYNIDVDKLESIAQFVTSPSVEESSHQTEVDANGEEIITMTAVWLDPSVDHKPLGIQSK